MFEKYGLGYDILSMQGKESKHSALKTDLKNSSNQSSAHDKTGKWHQLARASFVQDFYFPYHFPVNTYISCFQSMNPPISSTMQASNLCSSFWVIYDNSMTCEECVDAIDVISWLLNIYNNWHNKNGRM